MIPGVIEGVRDRPAGTIVKRIRHRRTGGDSWQARFACADPGERIVFPFDDEMVDKCPACWEDDDDEG